VFDFLEKEISSFVDPLDPSLKFKNRKADAIHFDPPFRSLRLGADLFPSFFLISHCSPYSEAKVWPYISCGQSRPFHLPSLLRQSAFAFFPCEIFMRAALPFFPF